MSGPRVIINRCPPEHYAFAIECVRWGMGEGNMPGREAIVARRGSGAFFIRKSAATISVWWQPDEPSAPSRSHGQVG